MTQRRSLQYRRRARALPRLERGDQHVGAADAAAGAHRRRVAAELPGLHQVAEKIGDAQPSGMIFSGRQPTGEIAEPLHGDQDCGEDLITSRILWLEGLEPGVNQGGDVDTHDRYIYIHGTNEEGRIGQTVSHGCIRMTNSDVIELFDRVETGTPVVIA